MKKLKRLLNSFLFIKHHAFKARYVLIAYGLMFSSNFLFAQETINISGKVVDSNNEVIPGANVILKGTTIGTITNVDGAYYLNDVPAFDTLIISFIGFNDFILPINNNKVLNATLQTDNIDLNEVVVVGYGSMRKADLTGSVSSLKEDELVKTAVPNITSTLAGKMTGVITRQTSGRPGADSPTFLIRGQSTYDPDNLGTNNPLVLVDGIERDFSRIDPNDIESITILKDAASAAIYGSRGANGVIVVTTKRGTNEQTQITFGTSYTTQSPTFRPEYMSAGEYAQYLNEATINKGGSAVYSDEEVNQYKDGTIPGTDWWSEVMSDYAPIKQYNLSVNGKSDKTSYFLSLGHLDQKGLYETASYKRYNLRSNIDTKISDNLSAHVNISLRKDQTNSSTTGEYTMYQSIETAIPTIPAYVPDSLRIDGDKLGLNFNGTAGSPIGEALYSGYNKSEKEYAETSMGINYNIPAIEGLSAKFEYAFDYSTNQGKSFNIPYTLNYYTRETGLTTTMESTSLTTLSQDNDHSQRQTIQTGINYKNTFGKHTISGLLMFEQMDFQYDYMWAYREDYLTTAIDQLFAGSDENKGNTGVASENARQGYIGRVVYNYNDKYLFQANARYDGSYNFPKESRWGLFPAFSVGWRISEEPFMKNISFINNLKLRASLGQFGNDRVDPYYYLSGYEFNNGMVLGDGGYYTGIMDTGIPNESITWETATSSNVGFEISLFQGKLSGEFDYFYKRTEDILIARSASIPYTFGSELPKENLGIVDNAGFESIIRYREHLGDFSYSIEGNLTYAASKVIYIDEPSEIEDRLKETGRPFNSWYGYEALGLFQTQEEIDNWAVQDGNGNASLSPGDIKYMDLNEDDVINDADRQYIGKGPTPEIIFGLNSSFKYKNIGLSMSFQGASNYTRYQYLGSFEKNYNTYAVLEDSWRIGNEDAKYPRLESNGRSANNSFVSSYWLNSGFYIKLRNIELSYTLTDKSYLDRFGIEEINLSASARNILTFAKKDGFDPEGTNNYYPIMKSMSVGLNIIF
jgi:TonB-linked SusC/RagA family outer membrane protein